MTRLARMVLCMGLLVSLSLSASYGQSLLGHLLPQPHSVRFTDAGFVLDRTVQLCDNAGFDDISYAVGCFLTAGRLSEDTEATSTIVLNKVSKIDGAFNHNVAGFDDESYSLVISTDSIIVNAVSRTGAIRAMQTLEQMTYDYPDQLPGVEIVDWPAFKVRGYMHDAGRSFISVAELKREIGLLSKFKVNVFHWHLTDHPAFRFESKSHPEVNTNFYSGRWPDSCYTQSDIKEICEYARLCGMTIIPEIDMPGHSTSFRNATGFPMASTEGISILRDILDEVIDVFTGSPYIHVGGDETPDATSEYVNDMCDYVRSKGKKAIVWNCYGQPLKKVTAEVVHCDMTTNWATSGTLSAGIPNIDMRYNYTNHFDIYADLAGIYRSQILYSDHGTDDVAGGISGMWNDRLVSDERLILRENNFYANVLATADRAWKGGGQQYIESGGAYLPNSGEEYEEFRDFEDRFLYHKAHILKDEPIAYVRQTNVRWCITPNTDVALEDLDSLAITHGCTIATGAGVWLNHIWAGTVGGVLGKASQPHGQTRYAWTWVYSDCEQEVGAQIEFYNYSRSDVGTAPANGSWDKMGSRLWVNDKEIKPNVNWTTAGGGEETDLGNVNFTARPVVPVILHKGWNKVLLKLPYKNAGNQRPNKWQYTFVLTDREGVNAVDGLIYSPSKNMDPEYVDTVPDNPDE